VPTEPRRILLVRLSHLGDVAHALPVFHALRSTHPRAAIAWAIQPEFEDLVRDIEGLERTIAFDRRGGARAWAGLVRELERFGADWAIDAQGNAKSAFVTLASRAPRRSGLAREDWVEPVGSGALTDAARPAPRDARGRCHAVERMLALCAHVAPGVTARFDPALCAAELALARAEIESLTEGEHAPIVLLHLARAGDPRSWPDARFEELARALAPGARVIVASGPSELEQGAALERSLRGVARVTHRRGGGPRALAAFLAVLAERGGRFVGCDSGPAHLAASVGLPVVVLAGPQDERRTGPWPPAGAASANRIVRASRQPACAPCLERRCAHPGGPVCMSDIAAADVARVLASAC
jgi:ADP-heptose:LPS heptosyltransferase